MDKKIRKRRVLVIEPDQCFLPELCDFLSHERMAVETAASGDEGIAKITKFKPDLVILSRELPMNDGATGPDGLRVLKVLKQDRQYSRLPIILTSNEATEKDFERYRKLKFAAEDFIRKPFEDTEILRRIENLIGFDISDDVDRLKAKIQDAVDDPMAKIFQADPAELGMSAATRQEVTRLLEEMGQELDRHENDLIAEENEDAPIEARPGSPAGEEIPSEQEILRLRQDFQNLNRLLEASQKQLVAERKRAREIKKEWKKKLQEIETRLKESEEREASMKSDFETMRGRFADLELEHTMELDRINKEKRYLEEEIGSLKEKLGNQNYPPERLSEDLYKVVKAVQTMIVRLEDDQAENQVLDNNHLNATRKVKS